MVYVRFESEWIDESVSLDTPVTAAFLNYLEDNLVTMSALLDRAVIVVDWIPGVGWEAHPTDPGIAREFNSLEYLDADEPEWLGPRDRWLTKRPT